MESDYLPHLFREWNIFHRIVTRVSFRGGWLIVRFRVEKNWIRDDFTFDLGKGSTSGATRDFHRCQCYAEQVSRADTHCERKTSGAVGVSVFCEMGEVGKTRVKNWARGTVLVEHGLELPRYGLWNVNNTGWNECCWNEGESGLESVVLQLEPVFITEIRIRILSILIFFFPTRPGYFW